MSLTILHTKDPRLDYDEQTNRVFSIMSGPSTSTHRTIVSNNYSNSQITFNIIPSSARDFVSRRIMCRTTFECTFVGTSAGVGIPLLQMPGYRSSTGAPLGNIGYAGIRCFPLATAMTNLQVSFNGTQIVTQLNRYSSIVNQRFQRTSEQEDRYFSLTPSQPDYCNDYGQLLGTNLSPFASYGANVLQESRGAYPEVDVIRNDSTGAPGDTCIVRFTVTEPLFMSPLVSDGWEDQLDLTGLQNLDILINLGGQGAGPYGGLVSSIFSINPGCGSTFTQMDANVLASEIQLSYISPSVMDSVPQSLMYNYSQPVFYPQGNVQPPILPGAVSILQMNTVQLQSIPQRAYFWVSDRPQDMTVFLPNYTLAVNNIQITFQNQVLLSSATRQDLYNMAQKNGANVSYRQFYGEVGSVVCLDFGTDIPLPSGQTPGMAGVYEFQLQYTCQNQTTRAINPVLNCLFMMEGLMMLNGTTFSTQIGVISPAQAMQALAGPSTGVYKRSTSIYGSGFWSSFKDFAKRLVRPVIEAARPFVASNPLASAALGVADQVASSYGRGLVGGGLVGGRSLTTRQLKALR